MGGVRARKQHRAKQSGHRGAYKVGSKVRVPLYISEGLSGVVGRSVWVDLTRDQAVELAQDLSNAAVDLDKAAGLL